jgi:hypothetical protein
MAEDPFPVHGISGYEYSLFKATKAGKGLVKLLDQQQNFTLRIS